MKMYANADGASRGNPGPAAYGAVVYDANDAELQALGGAIGRNTNNVAEYRGAIAAVQTALDLGATELELRLDSELIVRQLQGRYRVKNAALKPLYAQLRAPPRSTRHRPHPPRPPRTELPRRRTRQRRPRRPLGGRRIAGPGPA